MSFVHSRFPALALLLASILLSACVPASRVLRPALFPATFAGRPGPPPPEAIRLELQCPEGGLETWLLLGEGVSETSPGPALILLHGNAMLIDHLDPWFTHYREMGVSLLLPEFRGYGASPGTTNERVLTADLVRAYDALAARPEVDPSRIAIHGFSLGGAAAAALASWRPPAALILESTFSSFSNLTEEYGVPRLVVEDSFDTEGAVKDLDTPLLVLHGKDDSMIPFEHGLAIHRAAISSELLAMDCDHNNCPRNETAYWGPIRSFLNQPLSLPEQE